MPPPKGAACKNVTVNVDVVSCPAQEDLHTAWGLMHHTPNHGVAATDVYNAPVQMGCLSAPDLATKPLGHTSPLSPADELLGKRPNRDEYIKAHETRIKTLWPEPTLTARKTFPDFCNIYSRIKNTARPNCFGAKIPLDSDLVIPAWREELRDYHDSDFCDYLEFGWPLGYHGDVSPQTTESNHPSGEAHLGHITDFKKERTQTSSSPWTFPPGPFPPLDEVFTHNDPPQTRL